jgi:hypothetical protein
VSERVSWWVDKGLRCCVMHMQSSFFLHTIYLTDYCTQVLTLLLNFNYLLNLLRGTTEESDCSKQHAKHSQTYVPGQG